MNAFERPPEAVRALQPPFLRSCLAAVGVGYDRVRAMRRLVRFSLGTCVAFYQPSASISSRLFPLGFAAAAAIRWANYLLLRRGLARHQAP